MCKGDLETGKPNHEVEHWHVMDADTCLDKLGVKAGQGLSTADAKQRLEKYGPNQLTEKKKKTLLERIWGQVNNVLVFILCHCSMC